MKFDDVRRLPKLPFILGDLALLALAWLIADLHPQPFAPLPMLTAAGCVVAACVLGIIPFIVNYVRDRDEAAASLHRELTEQFKRLMTASEHFQNATAQLKTAEEIATKNLQAAERLPFQMQEKITDFTRQIAEAENAEKVAVEQELTLLRSTRSEHLATVADRILKAAAEYTKLEAEARQQLAAAAELEPKLAGVLTAIDARVAALATAVQMADRLFSSPPFPPKPRSVELPPESIPPPVIAAVAPPAEPPPASGPLGDAAEISAAAPGVTDTPAATPPTPRKSRAPRKPRAEESATAESANSAPADEPGAKPAEPAAAELIVEPVADEPPAPENFSQVPPEETKPVSVPSADGLTRLTVVSYIGIGNKLFLRGEGPGLSWDKGVPLQFVSIGRWRWETDAATGPITCKIYKNDKLEAPIGTLALTPGAEQEVTATF